MKSKKKALLLASIASLGILCGCGKEKHKTIETEDGTYIEANGEYVRVNTEPKRFESGTHVIYYVFKNVGSFWTNNFNLKNGFGTLGDIIPETPEGYRLLNISGLSDGSQGTDGLGFVYINEVPVLAEGFFNEETGLVEYTQPGTVIDELELKK